MMHVFTIMKTFSSFRSALWMLLYRKSLATSCCFTFCGMIRNWPCLLFHYNSCCCIISSDHVYCFTVLAAYCIARHSPCLHSFHLLGGIEENDWYLARIWTRDPSYMRRVCYLLCRCFQYCVRRIYRQEHLKPTEVFRVCFMYCLTSLRG
jgi:hypothetical protein